MDEDLTVGDVSSYRSWNGSISYQAVTDGAPTYYYSQTTRHLLPGMTEAQVKINIFRARTALKNKLKSIDNLIDIEP